MVHDEDSQGEGEAKPWADFCLCLCLSCCLRLLVCCVPLEGKMKLIDVYIYFFSSETCNIHKRKEN